MGGLGTSMFLPITQLGHSLEAHLGTRTAEETQPTLLTQL